MLTGDNCLWSGWKMGVTLTPVSRMTSGTGLVRIGWLRGVKSLIWLKLIDVVNFYPPTQYCGKIRLPSLLTNFIKKYFFKPPLGQETTFIADDGAAKNPVSLTIVCGDLRLASWKFTVCRYPHQPCSISWTRFPGTPSIKFRGNRWALIAQHRRNRLVVPAFKKIWTLI